MKSILVILGLLLLQVSSFAQQFNAQLIVQETNIEIHNNKLTRSLYYEIRINNRAGEKYAKISIPYSKLNKISNIEASVLNKNGDLVKKLKSNEIVDRSSISNFSFYEDDFVKEFTLKHNTYPYTIRYSYQIQQNEFLYIDNWIPIIDEKIPTISAKLNISVPSDYKIIYKNNHVNDPEIDTLKGVITYQWHTSYINIFRHEELSPPIYTFLPFVTILPEDYKFETDGSFRDWVSFGNWQYKLLQEINKLPEIEKIKINALIKDIKSDREKIKLLYHYLQDETRYINITIETGGLKPYPATYVAQNKYGDCKALTNYFKSILDFLQINSYYTNVYAGNPVKEIDKSFPSQQFNHVILYVPQEDGDLWLDCTSDGAFNYLGTFTQNRDALIVDYNQSHFMRTPALRPEDVLETRKIEIGYNPHEVSAKFRNKYKGYQYERLLNLEKDYNKSEKSRIVRNYFIEDGFQLSDYQISSPDRDSVQIELSYKATSQQIYKHYGNDILVGNIPFTIPRLEKPKDRKLPVQIDYPIYKIDSIIYDIPDGYKFVNNTDNYSISNKFGQYSFDIIDNNDKLTVIKKVLIKPGHYQNTEYEDFYNFIKQVYESENSTHISLVK